MPRNTQLNRRDRQQRSGDQRTVLMRLTTADAGLGLNLYQADTIYAEMLPRRLGLDGNQIKYLCRKYGI